MLGVVLGTAGALGTWQLASPTAIGHSASVLRSGVTMRTGARTSTASRISVIAPRIELAQPRLFADRK
ncbi:MAG: hypothetical protein IPQ07_33070 [Myxococcales bacterium]|nr:hypothetical protein [Myxococcales bacterium]